MDCDADGLEANPEYEENGGGVGVGDGPLAVLFCVNDDKSAGPGISALMLVNCPSERKLRHRLD